MTNNFRKQTIINSIAKYYAATLETLNKTYVHENEKELDDFSLKMRIAVKGCEISQDYFTKREREAIAFLTENCGDEWKMDPMDLAALMDGNADGYKTFDQYMCEDRTWNDDDVVIARSTVTDFAEHAFDRICEELGSSERSERR